MLCRHCGHPITGECKTKNDKGAAPRSYIYYRCANTRRRASAHPRAGSRSRPQVLAVFDKMRIEDEGVRDWFRRCWRRRRAMLRRNPCAQRAELQRQETLLVQQQDRLLNLRLADDIDQETFATQEHGNPGPARLDQAPT